MRIRLRRLPATVLGIYGPDRSVLPERMRYLEPAAAEAFLRQEATPHRIRVSDMLRSAESSLRASAERRGVQRPAFSGHNFGFSIDIHVLDCMRRWKVDKQGLDQRMAESGWLCHRRDHLLGPECHHYNFFGTGPDAERYLRLCARSSSTAAALEAKIQDHYGAEMHLSPRELQVALKRLRLYSGGIDGDLGPLSRQALRLFQRTWGLVPTGDADTVTQRTLAYVTAEIELA